MPPFAALLRGFFTVICLCPAGKLVAEPTGASIISGSATVTYGATTTIDQSSNQLVVNWDSFSIGAGEQVNFVQPSASSVALNHDISGVASQLLGDLNANGQVYLFNSAGILIGSGANINVGGFMASDMDLTGVDVDDIENQLTMSLADPDSSQGGIQIDGAITTTTRQGITLIAQFIENNGSLTAQDGDIHLVIADGPIVVTSTNGTMGVQISEGIDRDISPNAVLLDNAGDIRAINGNIDINIQYINTLNLQAVRNTGLINAVGIGYGQINQNIVLQAPPSENAGSDSLDAVLTDAVAAEVELDQEPLVSNSPELAVTRLDNLIADCNEQERGTDECRKRQALKRYLGRLLIGGDLPE